MKVAELARGLGRAAVAIGSTDLTHYGPNYDFEPHGSGTQAVEWVKTVNDAAFLRAVLACDGSGAIERATADSSACSPGAAVGAMGFAAALGASSAALIAYGTSADIAFSTSFVGYGAIAWRKGD
jgi:AmmeMemoRadiSam system protein B